MRVPAPIIQTVVTVALAAGASFVGVLVGGAVIKSQMSEFDRRLTKVEGVVEKFNEQQVEVYRNQVVILTRQVEQQREEEARNRK